MVEPPGGARVGPASVLLGLYGLFVIAAGSRSVVQLILHAGRAPLAYGLSATAALAYAVGFGLVLRAARGSPRAPAMVWCAVEFAGVLAVGVASYARPAAFPDATVWSHFGAGYAYLPLLLPIAVLAWLRHGPGGEQR